MAEVDLEALVLLAKAPSLAALDEERLSAAASAFESNTPHGSRGQAKQSLIERLTGVCVPAGIGLGACDTIVRNYVYLTKELRVKDIGKVVTSSPSVLGLTIECMQTRVDYLQGLGVENIGKVVTRSPQVLELMIEGMRARVDYLRELGVRDIGKVVARMPQVLELTIKWMQEKFDSYVSQGYGIADIEQFPASLGYSLENRIEPRFAFLQQLSASLGSGNTPLSTMLAPKDTAFSKRFAGNEWAYGEFLQKYSAPKPQS